MPVTHHHQRLVVTMVSGMSIVWITTAKHHIGHIDQHAHQLVTRLRRT